MKTTTQRPADESTPSAADELTMSAIVQDRYGSAAEDVLGLAGVARPTIGDGEVLVRVRAASVDQGTVHCMTGLPYAMRLAGFGIRRPKAQNPARCLSGTVESVGKAVTGFKAGDEVYGTCTGSLAEYVSAQPGRLAPKPANLSFEQAAALPVSGLAALQAVRDRAQVQPGQRMLVIGASGGVGSLVVQIAKAWGALVTGVCSTANMERVRSSGVDRVIDYTVEECTDGGPAYDVIIDTGGNRRLSQLRQALVAKGVLVIVGGETDGRWLGGADRQLRASLLSLVAGQKLCGLMTSENAKDLIVLKELVEAGKVMPLVERTYPLSDAAAAIGSVQHGGTRGKAVITI